MEEDNKTIETTKDSLQNSLLLVMHFFLKLHSLHISVSHFLDANLNLYMLYLIPNDTHTHTSSINSSSQASLISSLLHSAPNIAASNLSSTQF